MAIVIIRTTTTTTIVTVRKWNVGQCWQSSVITDTSSLDVGVGMHMLEGEMKFWRKWLTDRDKDKRFNALLPFSSSYKKLFVVAPFLSHLQPREIRASRRIHDAGRCHAYARGPHEPGERTLQDPGKYTGLKRAFACLDWLSVMTTATQWGRTYHPTGGKGILNNLVTYVGLLCLSKFIIHPRICNDPILIPLLKIFVSNRISIIFCYFLKYPSQVGKTGKPQCFFSENLYLGLSYTVRIIKHSLLY